MERCFIFCAGSFFGLREAPLPGDLIIAADAGYMLCKKLGLVPDLLVGDFDSMEEPEACFDILHLPVEKDDTDSMRALREGLARGCREFFLYGATGGARLDHTLANLQALAFLKREGARGWLYDGSFRYTVLENESITLRRRVDWGIVSLFAANGPVRGLTLRGLQYPLTEGELDGAFPLGVSNHFTEDSAVITVREGMLLLGEEIG